MESECAPSPTRSLPLLGVRLFLWSIWGIYIGYLLLSDWPPGPSLLHTQPETLQEAIDLSLNFWFVLPALFPAVAPVLHPALEGLFNLVVAWGLLFWGFLLDGRNQRWPMLPFLLGTALLTNVFYLPWLALRQPNPSLPEGNLTRLERVAESRGLPLTIFGVVLVSIIWALWGRPEFGGFQARWLALAELVNTDRLAYSFVIDGVVFTLFQSWLVGNDMARRGWRNPYLLWVARCLPLFGLILYLWARPLIRDRTTTTQFK